MREFLIKYTTGAYNSKVLGVKIQPPRIATIIVLHFLIFIINYKTIDNMLLHYVNIGVIVCWFYGVKYYFKCNPVKWAELSDNHKIYWKESSEGKNISIQKGLITEYENRFNYKILQGLSSVFVIVLSILLMLYWK